ncbi:hypothetical protein L4A35_30060, partial [Salmonella enterica subsp. diarizonae serovar 16:z10:e,n,x,z15]|nr:hypothetical protein [Salmonella enterica subsp. diarizonae serovar 16:z10:e,n,x,z15]
SVQQQQQQQKTPHKTALLCSSVGASIKKYHSLGGLNNKNLFSQGSGGWKFKIKVFAGLVSSETSVFDLQMKPSHCV